MQSCSQCHELPLNAKLLTSHTNFFFFNQRRIQQSWFLFFCAIFTCADCDLSRFCCAEMFGFDKCFNIVLNAANSNLKIIKTKTMHKSLQIHPYSLFRLERLVRGSTKYEIYTFIYNKPRFQSNGSGFA